MNPQPEPVEYVRAPREPIEHELKCWPEPFAAMKSGAKGFEYRRADRDYRVGDKLRLREWRPSGAEGSYTGDECVRTITFVLPGGLFGVPEGFCVMSVAAPPQPEPVADAGGVVERLRQAADDQAMILTWPWPALCKLLSDAADSITSLLAQVESLKAERDDLQAEAGTQALTIRRLTQEREELQDALATEREAKARMVEREAAARDPDILTDAVALTWGRCGFDPLPVTALGMIGRHLSECVREVAVATLQATGGEHDAG